MKYEDLIRHFVDYEGHVSYKQLSDADRTEIAIALYTESPEDAYEIFHADPSLQEMFTRAKEGDLAELGLYFVKAMHCASQEIVEHDIKERLEYLQDIAERSYEDSRYEEFTT